MSDIITAPSQRETAGRRRGLKRGSRIHRRSPQRDKVIEAVEALTASGQWPPNQTRDEQHLRVEAYCKQAGYRVPPSRSLLSRVMISRERKGRSRT